MKIGRVYMIMSPNGKKYIGSTTKTFKDRWRYYHTLHCKTQIKLYNSLKKYGVENHIFYELWEGDINLMLEKEAFFGINNNVLDNKIGLNLRLPKIFDVYNSTSKETCLKISNSLKNRILSEEHKINLGKASRNPSLETRLKMSVSKKNMSIITKEKMSKAQKKAVLQYDLNGNFIQEWDSGLEAAKKLNLHQTGISSCCNGILKSAGKFIWKFKN